MLRRLRYQLDDKATFNIYMSLIIPVLRYCSLLTISLTSTQSDRLKSLDRRASNIIRNPNLVTPSIDSMNKKHACMFVKKCLNGSLCENFNNYFTILSHKKQTRNNHVALKLPKVRTEFAKKSVFFSAAKLYNELPNNIRHVSCESKFRSLLNNHFT